MKLKCDLPYEERGQFETAEIIGPLSVRSRTPISLSNAHLPKKSLNFKFGLKRTFFEFIKLTLAEKNFWGNCIFNF